MRHLPHVARGFGLAMLAASFTSPATAQDENVLREHGDDAREVVPLDEMDGDGVPDYAVGAPDRAQVHVVSGSTGAILRTLTSPAGTSRFGYSLATIRDLDGDGRRDLVVGALGTGRNGDAPGTASVMSTADGAEICTATGGHPFEYFGWVVAEVADVTGDGRADFAVGAAGASGTGYGYVRVHSGADGSAVQDVEIHDSPAAKTDLGRSVVSLGDVNSDDFGDFAVGAPLTRTSPTALPTGAVLVVSGKDGSVLRVFRGRPGETVGGRLATLGDLDGDRIPDLAVSMSSKDGGIYVLSGRKLAQLGKIAPPSPGRYFSSALGAAGDVDGDGLPDVAAAGTGGFGFACAISSALRVPAMLREGGDGDYLGLDAAVGVGDLTGDGIPEIAVSGIDFVRIYRGSTSVLPPLARTYPLQRPSAEGDDAGTLSLKVKGTTVTVTLKVKMVAAGDRLDVFLEDAPSSGAFGLVGELLVTNPKKGTGTLTLTGTGGPPSALGVASLAGLSGRRLELRTAGGATLLSAEFPPLAPLPSAKGTLPLLPPPGGPLPKAKGSLKLTFTAATFTATFDLRTTGLPKVASYALFVEDAPSSGTFLDVGALERGRYLRSTKAGAPLPAGVLTLTELSGRRIEVRDTASGTAVLTATIP